jgi:hypothetical protein
MKTATNPQTGQKIYWDGEQWLPLKTATNKETGEVIGIVNGETFTVTPPTPREPESMRGMIAETPERQKHLSVSGRLVSVTEDLWKGLPASSE